MGKLNEIKIDQSLFWDIDPKQMDWNKHKSFVIGRVLNQGDVSDYRVIRDYYGDQTIIRAAKKIRYLNPKSLNFWSLIFKIPKSSFLCFQIQSHQKQSAFMKR